jgi:protocatechuate 3,4-dioxygenase beta subunit
VQGSTSELSRPAFGHYDIAPLANNLTKSYANICDAVGKRFILHCPVLDENGQPGWLKSDRPMRGGRYRHKKDIYLAPIDPNVGGCGHTLTDENGYHFFSTTKPGAFPQRNWVNNWRPGHIHVSVFGTAFAQHADHPDVVQSRPPDGNMAHRADHSGSLRDCAADRAPRRDRGSPLGQPCLQV